jgi:hypothetical protein
LPNPQEQIDAIHFGHLEIGDCQVKTCSICDHQSDGPIVGSLQVTAIGDEKPLHRVKAGV